ncbi:hypothetical protein GCM10022254_34050 [Actinomadura meridiana]|uniref:Uncharacterized protein n=1 Tax=Actinomadura meridiana TaxID=559626 RepID=A0ABP8C397_9ACTN
MKQSELDRVIHDLKPVSADELADAAYARHSDAAMVRARAGRPEARERRRPVRRLAFATGAVAAVTATAVLATVALSGGDQGAHDGRAKGPGEVATIDARTFLLASAEKVAKEPATHGTCWYTRTRTWQDLAPRKPRPGEPISRDPRQTFRAQTASSAETWSCTLPGVTRMRFRTRVPLDIKVTFPTEEDEKRWRAAGSPPISLDGGDTTSKPFTTTYEQRSHLVNPVIGSHEIEWKNIAKLPATKQSLNSYLRKLWNQDRKGGANGYTAPADYGQYVFVSAWDLFMAPTTPGTRAALYRILSDDPSIQVTGRMKDRDGRSGVTVTARGTGVRLVIDPSTARLLDYLEFGDGGTVNEYLAFERQGWVNKIGTTPAS